MAHPETDAVEAALTSRDALLAKANSDLAAAGATIVTRDSTIATQATKISDLQTALDACEATQPPPPPPPVKKLLVGAAVQGNSYATLQPFETSLAHTLDCYRSYGGAPSAAEVQTHVVPSKGKRRVLVGFVGDPKNPSASFAGIDAANAALAAFGDDVDVTMNHEPIRKDRAYTPAEFLAATNLWAPRFDAPNVRYGIIHTADNYKTKNGVVAADAAGWPTFGPNAVEWIGADGYNWGNVTATPEWIFKQAVAKAIALGVDLLIPEVGFDGANAGNAPASGRPALITGLFTYARANPVIKRIFYFNTHDPKATAAVAPKGNCHWELSDAASMAAFKTELLR